MLLILDGWGHRQGGPGNAIEAANPTFYHSLLAQYPHITIQASGPWVGLPEGQMGNSEVGHLNIGAGRVVYQEISRISKAIKEGDFFENAVLLAAIDHAKRHHSTLHLMGLLSTGGVHSSMEHMFALLDLAKEQGLSDVRLHAFLDGRDVSPKSAGVFLQETEKFLDELELPQIATICGRYWAMDRDKRWDRTKLAYDSLTLANGQAHLISMDALAMAYNADETDEFVKPRLCDLSFKGIQDDDAVVFFNFRPDRARQLTRAFTEQGFDGFERQRVPENLYFATLTTYDETYSVPVAFPKEYLTHGLGQVLSEQGLKQLRTAETEKYAHITYFFNGGLEAPYEGEDRHLVPSPKVATYDQQPEMSVSEVTQVVLTGLESDQYAFIGCNIANPDMVGHTGSLEAAIQAVKAVDGALSQIIPVALSKGWAVLLTADHGNIETMIDEHGGPHTAHTTLPVPLVLISNEQDWRLDTSRDALSNHPYALGDLSPTILDMMGVEKPSQMTGQSMLVRQTASVS